MTVPARGEGALTTAMEKLRKLRDKAVNSKRIRKGTRKGKQGAASHKPTAGRTRQQIMDELT